MLLLLAAFMVQVFMRMGLEEEGWTGRRGALGDFLQWPYAWCYLFFVRHYFQLNAASWPGWDRFYRVLAYAYLGALVLILGRLVFGWSLSSWVMLALNLTNLLGGFLLACMAWRRAVPGAGWFVLANVPLTLAGTLHGLQWALERGGESINGYFPFWAGIVLQLLLFLAALGARYRRLAQNLVTEAKRREQAQREASELAAAMRAKDEMLAFMSHEVRTPVNAVIGMSQLLGETSLDQEQRRLAHTIQGSGRLLLALVDGVLDLARCEAGYGHVEARPFDVALTLAATVDLLRPAAEEKTIALDLVVDAAVPAWLTGDVLRIQQIALNLTANAVKFTRLGRVEVAVTWVAPDQLCLRVSDTGTGVPPERRERLFEPFFQAYPAAGRRMGGTGLGLSIARRLARLLGGDVVYAPRPAAEGGGSIFTATVRAGEVMESEAAHV
jgi:signal transduction histidine kinase